MGETKQINIENRCYYLHRNLIDLKDFYEYYKQSKEAIKEKPKERYKNLSQEKKGKIKEYQYIYIYIYIYINIISSI